MKFLIVGFGSIGRRHFRNLLELGEKDILFLRSGKSTLEDDELKDFLVETDPKAALAHQPDGVIIANPSSFHLDLAIPAAKQGCHLMIEKPLSNTMERVDDLKRLVKENGTRVLMGFQFRYHPNLIKIKGLLESGVIGRPLSVRSHWGEYLPDWHPWEDYRQSYAAREELGGGVLLTLCHNFDYLHWLFGPMTIHSALLGHDGLDIPVEDTAEVSMTFKDGLIGSLHLNFTQRPPSHLLEIVGSGGTIKWDYHQNLVTVHTVGDNGQLLEDNYPAPDGFERNDLFLKEMEHFLGIINGREESHCSLDDGIIALEYSLRAKELGAR